MLSKIRSHKDILLYLIFSLIVITGTWLWLGQRPTAITINWATESELDIVGFNLYRADSAAGDYQQLNEALIPPATDPFVGGNYQFVDDNVQRGQTYYYVLETIDRNGTITRRDPAPVPAK